MRVRIHRGAAEIGGSCIEVAADDGSRLVLDVGRPLWAGFGDAVALPGGVGFDGDDPDLVGVVLTHPHLDHFGLVEQVAASVPVYIGREAASLLNAAAFFSPASARLKPKGFLEHGQALVLGPFVVTPHLNDHSAFDAYSLMVEADGRRLFYTGDIRGHGRKAKLFEQLVRFPPADVDVLLMEGTHVRSVAADDGVTFPSESDLEEEFVRLCREREGMVAVFGSVQNLDRVVTVYRAAKRSGRVLVVDLYGATVAAATRPSIPQPGFEGLRVYVPQRQRVRVKEAQEFWRVDEVRAHRVFPAELRENPGGWVAYLPSSAAYELASWCGLDTSGVAVWSLWRGYLDEPAGKRLTSLLAGHGVPFEYVHTSGHASIGDLKRLVDAFAPARVVPIHSEATHRFAELFPRVEPHPDGEWWEV